MSENMLTNFVNRLLELKRPEVTIVDGRNYATDRMAPILEPVVPHIELYTLQSLVELIEKNLDNIDTADTILHVAETGTVQWKTAAFGPFKQRNLLGVAKNSLSEDFRFGVFMDQEAFRIGLMAQFVEGGHLADVQKVSGNITDSLVSTIVDDGVTQQASVRVGIARVEKVDIPPIVDLAPYRSFREIEQPMGKFVFRIRSGGGDKPPAFALFEADGGAWRLEVVKRIKDWLAVRLPEMTIIA